MSSQGWQIRARRLDVRTRGAQFLRSTNIRQQYAAVKQQYSSDHGLIGILVPQGLIATNAWGLQLTNAWGLQLDLALRP